MPCPSVCLYIREVVPHFLIYRSEISNTSFSPKMLLICRKRRYRTTIAYTAIQNTIILMQSPKKSDQTAIAYSRHTNWTIRIKCLHGKLFYLTRYRHEIRHRLLSKTIMQSPNSDRITIAYSCHIN